MSDIVNHPEHYTSRDAQCAHCGGQIECIQVAQTFTFSLGNAIKYLWRAGAKGDAVEDLRKAAKYIEFEIARLEADRAQMRAELEQDMATEEPLRLPHVTVDGLPTDHLGKLFRFPPPAERWHE